MESIFSFDFSNLLKKIQLSPIKIAISIILTFTLTSIQEYTFFFSTYTKYDISGCQLPNNPSSSYTINNCFDNNNKDLTLTNCLNNQYNTGSNYSLEFNVSTIGTSSDKYSKLILVASIFLWVCGIMGMLQLCNYLSIRKRKRIQDILAGSMVFLDGKNKYERLMGIYFIFMTGIYLGLKLTWIIYRSSFYGKIDCDGSEYNFKLQQGVSTSAGVIFQTILTCLILPLVYVFIQTSNFLSDVDMKSIMTNMTNESIKQFKGITVLQIEKYRELISKTLKDKYPYDNNFKRILRLNTFSFLTTSTNEIIQIINQHKLNHPEDFEPMLFKESKISIKSFIVNENDNNLNQLNNSFRSSGMILNGGSNNSNENDSIDRRLVDTS